MTEYCLCFQLNCENNTLLSLSDLGNHLHALITMLCLMFFRDTLHEFGKNFKCVDQAPHSNKELLGPDDYITQFSERLLIPLTSLFIESLSSKSWQRSRSEADVKLTFSMVAWNPFHVSFDVCKTTNLSLDSTTFDSMLGMTCTFMHCCTCLRLMSHLPGRRTFDSFSIQRNKASLLKRSTLQLCLKMH